MQLQKKNVHLDSCFTNNKLVLCRVLCAGGWSVCHHSSSVCLRQGCGPGSVKPSPAPYFSHTATFPPKTSNCITSASSLNAKLGQRCAANPFYFSEDLGLAPQRRSRARAGAAGPRPPPSCPPQPQGPPSTAPDPAKTPRKQSVRGNSNTK